MRFRGVLFDWRGTLFHDIDNFDWVRLSAESIGRRLADADIRAINEAISRAAHDPGVVAESAGADASAERHRAASLLQFRKAGIDDALAIAIYERDGLPEASLPYPDAPAVL